MRHEISEPHFLETTQQSLQAMLPGAAELDESLQHALDRSCTLHCVEAIAEMSRFRVASFQRLEEYVEFLRAHGAQSEALESNDFYDVNDGWYSVAIADLLRANGFSVVLQRLQYDEDSTQMDAAVASGRVRSAQEGGALEDLKFNGGERGVSWLNALSDTLDKSGYTIVSIRIPSSKVAGSWGQHSVVVLQVTEEGVVYFDPDELNTARYGKLATQQGIRRQDSSKLIYSQGSDHFLGRMTGEVMHIFPPSN